MTWQNLVWDLHVKEKSIKIIFQNLETYKGD